MCQATINAWNNDPNMKEYMSTHTCNCSNGANALPVCRKNENQGSGGSSSSSGYSPQTQMMQDILQPVFDNFFKWLFSEPSAEDQQKQQAAAIAAKQAAEQQIINKAEAQAAYDKMMQSYKLLDDSHGLKMNTLNNTNLDFKTLDGNAETIENNKNRYAVSEATKTVKQLNCAAYTSLQALEVSLNDFGDFKDIDGSAEQASKLADFTTSNSNGCPEIKIDIPEVCAAQPISFQELFYSYVKHQSDSIKSTINTLKVKKIKNDKVIEEKKQKIEETKLIIERQTVEVNPNVKAEETNQLLIDAMKELEEANRELQTAEELEIKMKEEIDQKERYKKVLTKMRSTYDVPKKQISS